MIPEGAEKVVCLPAQEEQNVRMVVTAAAG